MIPIAMNQWILGGCTYTESASLYLHFATWVPSPVVWFIGIGKLHSYHAKWPWSWKQRLVVILLTTAIILASLVHQYQNNYKLFYVYLPMVTAYYSYIIMTHNEPELTGGRAWDRKSLEGMEPMLELCREYISLKIVVDQEEQYTKNKDGSIDYFPKNKGCILGFAPHGLLPLSAGLAIHSPEWRRMFPAATTHFMTDQFTHLVHQMRDWYQWFGVREVSRSGVIKVCLRLLFSLIHCDPQFACSAAQVLKQHKNAMLVPGGHHEIFTSKSWGTKVFIYSGHQGFVRVALEQGAALVPCLSMGEWKLQDNIYLPTMQVWPLLFYCRFLLLHALPILSLVGLVCRLSSVSTQASQFPSFRMVGVASSVCLGGSLVI
jgi:hypothetical protein